MLKTGRTKYGILDMIYVIGLRMLVVVLADCVAKQDAKEILAKLLSEEGIKWAQGVKAKDVREGDSNSKFSIQLLMGNIEENCLA